jgi:hypothetical protein
MTTTADFNTLEALYKHIERTIITKYDVYEIKDLLKAFRDRMRDENKPDEANKAQWEMDFVSFVVEEGEIGPETQRYKDGQVSVYPHVDLFDEPAYEYLITRLNTTNHPKLKAQYAQILWCTKKHNKYAEIAIDSYLELVSIYEQEYDNQDKHKFAEEISEAIINAYSIARRINDRVEEIKVELKRLIQKFSLDTPFCAADLIEFMLKHKKGFTKQDFVGLDEFCRQKAESSKCDSWTAIKFLALGKRVDEKLDNQSYNWDRRIAQHYENRMQQVETAPLVALDFCMEAIKHYQQIGDDKKLTELQQRYAKFRGAVELSSSETEVDITEIVKACKEFAKQIVKHCTSDDIIGYFISGKDLLPTYQQIEESVQEQIKQSPTAHLLSKSIRDERGNPTQHFDSNEEKQYFDILDGYRRQLHLYNRHLIREVFFEAILAEKLNFKILMGFITKHCWYGKEFARQLPNNQTIQFSWLDLIAPALREYFRQINFYFENRTANVPNFVLSLDSLTLKIEGLLRDLCQLTNVVTSKQKLDKSKRTIVYEKDITALLHDDAIKTRFDQDDILFFKFLLTEQWGFNLRHNIAHCLMSSEAYHLDCMHLVILALLRLGRYDFTQDSDAESHADEDSDLYSDDEIVASLDRARDQMRQGKFIPKEDVLEDV